MAPSVSINSQHHQGPVRDVVVVVGLDDADLQVFPFYKEGFMRYDVMLYLAQLL
jgi:hypothetical protein